jgi:gas vesicle protein GvpN
MKAGRRRADAPTAMSHTAAPNGTGGPSAVHLRGPIEIEAGEDFVLTDQVRRITERALAYLRCGYAVHLAGPAGTGKTTLAFHIAAQLGNGVTLLHGNDEFGSSDLIGKDAGYRKSTLVDNFIHSVLKTEERVDINWTDNRLTLACEQGHTLVYDEFNRSKPEANNILLSVLEEGILDLPKLGGDDSYIDVHPNFRAILTSNPEEYAGTHGTQDALLDRLITIEVGHYDAETERRITSAKGGVPLDDAAYIVEVARILREVGGNPHRPTIRACIAIAKVCAAEDVPFDPRNQFFRAVCRDALLGAIGRDATGKPNITPEQLDELLSAVRAEGGFDGAGGLNAAA